CRRRVGSGLPSVCTTLGRQDPALSATGEVMRHESLVRPSCLNTARPCKPIARRPSRFRARHLYRANLEAFSGHRVPHAFTLVRAYRVAWGERARPGRNITAPLCGARWFWHALLSSTWHDQALTRQRRSAHAVRRREGRAIVRRWRRGWRR